MKMKIALVFILFFFTHSFAQKKVKKANTFYVCLPCHNSCDTLLFNKPGKCNICDMSLVSVNDINSDKYKKTISICFYLQDGVEVLDFAGPLEVFTAAGFDVSIVSKNRDTIYTQGTLSIIPSYSIDNAPDTDVIVFFGGNTQLPSNDTTIISWIKSRAATTKYFMSVCTGAFFLGRAGLLDGMKVTTFHSQVKALQKEFPKTKVIPNVRFIDNGTIITTAGISAGIDGAFHLVEKFRGRDFAKMIAKEIEYDKWIPENGLIIEK